jgi:hypothetical protein
MKYGASHISHFGNILCYNTDLYSYSLGIWIIFNLISSFDCVSFSVDSVNVPEAKQTIRFSDKLKQNIFIPG